MYELGMWDWEYEIDLREGLVNTYSDEGKTNAKHKPDNCKVTGKLVNTDCLFAAPKNGLDLEGDNKQHQIWRGTALGHNQTEMRLLKRCKVYWWQHETPDSTNEFPYDT